MAGKCTALNLSDEQRCTADATNVNGLFCSFHARQVFGLYRGYKTRGSKLEALEATPPAYLSRDSKPLRNVTFEDVEDEETLNTFHAFLFKKYALLDRVIRARKLHHSRFYSLTTLDYGHKAYLDKLTNDRLTTRRALERLERRTAEVLYDKAKWFGWVRQRQDEEEAGRENEAKQIKREAQLFRKHWKEMETRLREKRRQEDLKRQEAFLDEAYRQRLEQMSEEDEESEWDPIEDELEEDREKFVDMMQQLLWLDTGKDRKTVDAAQADEGAAAVAQGDDTKGELSAPVSEGKSNSSVEPAKALNRNQKKRAKKQAKQTTALTHPETESSSPRIEVNETQEEIRERLLKGATFNPLTRADSDSQWAGTITNPAETIGKIPGMPVQEVEKLIDEIREIKQLLLCRLLLSHATLLPIALKAKSLDEFFSHPEISAADLRDLCLKLEQPSLQEVRDACADFARGDTDEADDDQNADEVDEQAAYDKTVDRQQRHGETPQWRSKHELEVDELKKAQENKQKQSKLDADGIAHIDFGPIEEEHKNGNTNSRISVCGRTIFNYPKKSAMPRGGWLHYSILAKGSRIGDALQLCRNWDEFWELNILAIYGYFPSTSWGDWKGDQTRTQFLHLGFIPRMFFNKAEQMTFKAHVGGRGTGPKMHDVKEFKNFMCAHIKRNDPVSRRFVQYLTLEARYLCVLVRDAKTGRIIVQPPKEHWWLVREKSGLGRASRYEWNVIGEVGEEVFEQLSDSVFSEYKFGFNEHYDIIVWDLAPGRSRVQLESIVQECLIKAHRFTTGRAFYNPAGPVLKTLHREKETMRCRDAKPGEVTIWDDIHHPGSRMFHSAVSSDGTATEITEGAAKRNYYNEEDVIEDSFLFPEESQGKAGTAIGGHSDALSLRLEASLPSFSRFSRDMDTDEESDSDAEQVMEQRRRRKLEEKKKGQKRVKTTTARALKEKNAQFNSGPEVTAERSVVPRVPRNSKELVATLEAARLRDPSWSEGKDECPNGWAADCDCNICERTLNAPAAQLALIREKLANGDFDNADPDKIDDIDDNYSDGEESEDDYCVDDWDLEDIEDDPVKLKKLKHLTFSDGPTGRDVEKDFADFIDRDKANVFKPLWHAADTEPGAAERWSERKKLLDESKSVNRQCRVIRARYFQVLLWLNVHPCEHRLVMRDIEDTFGFVGMFFPESCHGNENVRGWRHATRWVTKFFDNDYKASQSPYSRAWRSILGLPEELYKPVDDYIESGAREREGGQRSWEPIARPTIAKLYKCGIIAPFHESNPTGFAFVGDDPLTGKKAMFLDYRRHITPAEADLAHITDWRKVDIAMTARQFSADKPEARFALLRMWSHSLFWPLMVGIDQRIGPSFRDPLGRGWQWKFYPKEWGGLEHSMQFTLDSRFRRWLPQVGRNIKVKRDMVLVMGKDQRELEEMLLATVFILHTNPWRLEIDFWKSLIDVDVDFIEKLDKVWVD